MSSRIRRDRDKLPCRSFRIGDARSGRRIVRLRTMPTGALLVLAVAASALLATLILGD
jgi:hypothetical protein